MVHLFHGIPDAAAINCTYDLAVDTVVVIAYIIHAHTRVVEESWYIQGGLSIHVVAVIT